MRLFRCIQPHVVQALSTAVSKIHISFDGWTTKGGKRGFFGSVAYFADASGVIRDLPIDLPLLAGAHTGEAISAAIIKTLKVYGITRDKLGYFVLDNAANNDTAIAALSRVYDFDATHRRLRCGPHTLNLIGQAIIFGADKEAYDNVAEQLNTEEVCMQEWRKQGPLGVLVDVINYIKTPQQYELFREFQRAANAELPAEGRLKVLEPVKPVVTRWNSYYAAFQRATQLQAAYNSYAEHHISRVALDNRRAIQHNSKRPDAPSWMRSTGLTAADWAVIAEYQDCLQPLKLATERLEGCSKAGNFGAIYEVIPVFEYVLSALEARTRPYERSKANNYYNKLDDSPVYYAAVCLHPYYKYYCENSWADKPEWLTTANAGFKQLWQQYKPSCQRPPSRTSTITIASGIDDVIESFTRRNSNKEKAAHDDEYERWKTQEPEWSREQYLGDGHPVVYWIQMRSKYPCLSQFAIDILTIPASSSDCERLFSELGDLLEPKRRAMGSELLAALQLVRSWVRAGFKTQPNSAEGDDEDDLSDEDIVRDYNIQEWNTHPE
ncbi:Dimer-Tnp-hAT dimerization containing protein [Pyrenophora tritici-repentis]|nr:Dimer-Tnp-hAT dimerization containing protein [Pyrenophora tritici-repentis]